MLPNVGTPPFSPAHQANGIITEDGLEGPVTPSRLEVLTTMDVVATDASFTRSILDC
jgi:hypothetical protein